MTNTIINTIFNLYKNANASNPTNKVRKLEDLKAYINNNWNDELETSKYVDFFKSIKNGEVITNKFGKKLYFKFNK